MKTAWVILVISISLYTVMQATDANGVITSRIEHSPNFYWVKNAPCSKSALEEQKSMVVNRCKPRKTIVDVAPDNASDGIFLPQRIKINRCAGGVFGKTTSCVPRKTKTIHVHVEHINKSMHKQCYLAKVVEHLECKIGCILTPENCTSAQKFHESICQCVCNNQTEVNACRLRNDAMWNAHACECRCNVMEECSTGLKFSHDICMCVIDEGPRHRNSIQLSKHKRGKKHST